MKKMLQLRRKVATFAALMCLMIMMPLTTWAGNIINTVTSSENITKTSTVYVGDVVVDGTSVIKYLYSGDMTLSGVVRQNLLACLNGMADGDYATLFEAYWPPNYSLQAFAFCSDPNLAAAMDENWSSATYVGMLYFQNKWVASVNNSNTCICKQ